MNKFFFREINDINDELLLPWLDLYEDSFPANEKLPVSVFLKVLKRKSSGNEIKSHLLAAVDKNGQLIGMANYEEFPGLFSSSLWYMAIVPEKRGLGIGSALYRNIISKINPSIKAVFIEVELPGRKNGKHYEQNVRRIEFYKRLGANIIDGIEYFQTISSKYKPLQMHLMVHCLKPLSPDEIFNLAKLQFGESVKRNPSQPSFKKGRRTE